MPPVRGSRDTRSKLRRMFYKEVVKQTKIRGFNERFYRQATVKQVTSYPE